LLEKFLPDLQRHRKFHALTDISLDVQKGQSVGIIGRNGAGKSTLLQLICGTLTPSSGQVEVKGRISALLELGTGFNPEFTGRENVYMNATLMGLKEEEIDDRYAAICEFADIGEYIAQPVKTYSSGMYMRLAFAVAINVDPDILIVDEALSVGDEAFQRKCFSRLLQIKENGGTLLFVSHSASLVVQLCDRALLLDRGELLLSGEPRLVVSKYHKLMFASAERAQVFREELRKAPLLAMSGDKAAGIGEELKAGNNDNGGELPDIYDADLVPKSTVRYERRGAEIREPHIQTLGGKQVNVLTRGREYDYVYKIRFSEDAFGVRWGCMIKTVTGLELGGVMSHPAGEGLELVECGSTVEARLRFRCTLLPGAYFLNAGVMGIQDQNEIFFDRIVDAVMFRVQPERSLRVTGVIDFSAGTECERPQC
jgi:lipopolysaccharide transport system ATP-binding protein